MKRNWFITLFAALMLLGSSLSQLVQANADEVMLYKNPQCGCCENYARYLRENGFKVTVKPTQELAALSLEAGLPEDYQGCHLALIDGYFVSGHVPVSTVNKMLTEQPPIKGITLPGMPQGSPGMSGVKKGPFTTYSVGHGQPRVYTVE